MIPLCSLQSIDNFRSKGFTLNNQNIFAIRRDDHVYVYLNRCPHLGVPLEWIENQFLDYDGELIQCSTHGALFTIEQGHCVSGPCSGQSLHPIASQVKEGDVWVDL